MTFDRKEDCGPVEKFIWDQVAIFYGNFEGVYKMSVEDLFILKGLIEAELYKNKN